MGEKEVAIGCVWGIWDCRGDECCYAEYEWSDCDTGVNWCCGGCEYGDYSHVSIRNLTHEAERDYRYSDTVECSDWDIGVYSMGTSVSFGG